MRKRIHAIAEGKVDNREMKVLVSQERIEKMARKNEIVRGSFTLESTDERKLKGLVYTTNKRMVCGEVQFFGRKVQIPYEFHTVGMDEGDTNKGEFYIESNAGEIIVPYVVSVTQRLIESPVGKIRDLFHFTNLAHQNFQEAYKLFCSKKFLQVKMDAWQKLLYEVLTQSHVCRENMEEFLIAIHKKEPIRFVLSAGEENVQYEGDSFKKSVVLSKNTWGYVTIQVSTDADFIYMEKPVITSEDFVGNHYEWQFIVEKAKLHAGKNEASITFSSGIQTETLKIEIGAPGTCSRRHTQEKRLIVKLCRGYLQVRNHDVKEAVWLKDALKDVETLNGLVPDHELYMLQQAQMYTMAGRNTECQWILNKFRDVDKDRDQRPEIYAYYQYVRALERQDEEFTQIVKREVIDLSDRHPQNFVLFLVRLFLDEDLERNHTWKYRMLKEQFSYGCRSPFLYLEAYELFEKEITLLSRLGEFEIQVLLFVARQGWMSAELAEKAAQLAMHVKTYNTKVFRVLTKAYEMFSLKSCVEAVCSMLIRSNKRQAVYFSWFERGVEEQLKLTQLFEYYMYTVPLTRKEILPKTLLIYFNIDNTLDYKRKAFLYANVWKNQDKLGDLFLSYEPRIRLFVVEQVMYRHINEHLAYLYRQLSNEILRDREASAVFEELIFVNKLVCDNSNIRHVIVRHQEIDREEIFPVLDGLSWVKLYHPQAMILLEDKDGRRHLDTVPYSLQTLVPENDVVRYCEKFEKVKLGLLLNRYYKKGSMIKEDTYEICEKLLLRNELHSDFKQSLIEKLINYEMDTRQYEKAEERLSKLDYKHMDSEARAQFIELMVTRGLYRQAYGLILQYGPEKIAPKRLVRLCSRLIVMDEEDEELLALCFYVFSKGKYDEAMLEYLTKYFYGATWQMDSLWRAAKQFEVETYRLGERILMQMLFTGYLLPDSGEIFEDYYATAYNMDVVKAYLAFFAYYYVIHEQIVDERVIHWMEREYRQGEDISLDCRAALLKYYSQMKVVPDDKISYLQGLLMDFVKKRLYFPFFMQLDERILKPAHLNEKMIIEHRAPADKRMTIFYRMSDGDYMREEMEQVYDCVFVKVLTVFYGEQVQYYLVQSDRDGANPTIVGSAVAQNHRNTSQESEGRFSLLNEMAASYQLKDEASFHEMMDTYVRLDVCTQELFSLRD